ncbi:putative cardiolipin synthase [Pseudoxanthomonas indica]|uniref:Putative cardiolipin synthase n=2 Tax=Pseudoxanthomonas indica TaxID=428993 RepID=A0A1T5LS32_9GAMM|nr:phospholipase D family protein [Pseudoxanthomonas indica]GGD38815.1 phospholipase D family protein [Pseudoxanthomonas indica]SKC78711.1 putative cardiolipin synthase [Pseudoxanthomonas indica]
MARKLRWFGLILLTLAVASFVSVFSYGRFAARVHGPPSHALALQPAQTVLDRSLSPLTQGRGQRSGITLLSDNLDAFAIRALTAQAAGRSLDLQYYLWHDDFTGQLLDRELLRAADRGVRVRLLLDDMNGHGKDSFLAAMDTHPNIEVRLFNPTRNRAGVLGRGVEMLLRGFSLNRRMHNKAWIADGRVAVVGGRNVGDEYFDAATDTNFLDLDVALLGPAVQQTEAIFDAFWNSQAAIPLGALVKVEPDALVELRTEVEKSVASRRADPYLARLAQSPSVRSMVAGEAPLYWLDHAQVVSDPPAKLAGEGQEQWLMFKLFPAMSAAKRELRIISPYYVPGDRGVQWAAQLRARGVKVGVLTNSLAATDVMAVHSGYAPYRVPLLRAGVELHELMPQGQQDGGSLFGSSGASLHTKAFAVDGETGFIGSFNLDPRSINLNTEMGILFKDKQATAQLLARYREKSGPEQSYRLALLDDGSLRWHEDAHVPPRVWEHEPGVGLWRRSAVKVLEWLPLESQL